VSVVAKGIGIVKLKDFKKYLLLTQKSFATTKHPPKHHDHH